MKSYKDFIIEFNVGGAVAMGGAMAASGAIAGGAVGAAVGGAIGATLGGLTPTKKEKIKRDYQRMLQKRDKKVAQVKLRAKKTLSRVDDPKKKEQIRAKRDKIIARLMK